MEELTFYVEEYDANIRIDVFLAKKINDLSRNAIQLMISDNNVLVNGKALKANYKVKYNDIVTVSVKEAIAVDIKPENISLNILYEDSELIVINKEKNMVVHPAPGHYSGTLVNALLNHCGNTLSGINGEIRPGIVHRIDKDTSGILVIAKNDFSHNSLSKQLQNHSMTRKYQAIVYNNIKEDNGIVNKPIGRSIHDRKKMSVNVQNGREAITHYKVLERFGKFTHIEAQLETGRTHQIRVHMASIGHPLLGDLTYANAKPPFNLEGQVLHAKRLGFIHPKTLKYMEFDSDLPEYFQKLLQLLRRG